MSATLRKNRDKQILISVADDEYDFFMDVANRLGIGGATVIRDAAVASLMSKDNLVEVLDTARENHVTELARVDRWRRMQAEKNRPDRPITLPKKPWEN